MKKVRVFFADDHEVVIRGLTEIFEEFNAQHNTELFIDVVGHGTSSKSLLDHAKRTDIDVYITDLGFESTQGNISIIKLILMENPFANIIVYSMRNNVHTIGGCYNAGAKAYVKKSSATQHLIDALFTVANGGDYFEPGILSEIGLRAIRDPLGRLDEREKRLFLMLAQNIDVRAIENDLGISDKTITNLIATKIKPVLGVGRKNFREYALKMGLIEDTD